MLYNSKYVRNIYYLDVGTNDIHNGSSTPQQTFNYVIGTLANAKALGYTAIGATLLHEYGETSSASSGIDQFNTLMRASMTSNPGSIDAFVDYAADPRLGIITNYYPTYSGDGTHPNNLGYQAMAQDAAPIFNQFIPGSTETSPTMPQWGLLVLGGLLFLGAVAQLPRLIEKV
jgi:lysophospholipase L1-like esterase